MIFIGDKTDKEIIDLYLNTNISVKELSKLAQHDLYSILKKYNVPSRRFSQEYEIDKQNNIAYIPIKSYGNILKCKIDLEDVDRCKKIGIWSVTKSGYVINFKNGIYLHRFIMNCPDDLEVDHIYHDLLDNRKSQLRIATSSEQSMNTKRRKDNTSGNRGIYYGKDRDTWNININFCGKHYRKRFKSKDEAIKIRDKIYENGFGDYRYKTSPNSYNVDCDGEVI